VQTFLSRPLSADEADMPENEFVGEATGPPVVAEAVRASANGVAAGVNLLSSLGGALTGGWGALESMLTDKPPGGEKDWWSFFGVPRSQKLLGSFGCGLSATGEVVQGRMYVFDSTVAFYSSVLGSRVTVVRASTMTDVLKVSVGLSSGLEIRTLGGGSTVLTNFMSRDAAFDVVHKVMWDHGEAPGARPQPVAWGFAGERYLFVRVASSRGAGASVAGNLSLSLSVGRHEARSRPAALLAGGASHDFVAVFPCSAMDPGRDALTLRLHCGNDVVGEAEVSLAAAPSAPWQPWLRSSWTAPLSWTKAGAGEVALALWTGGTTDPAFRTGAAARAVAASTRSGRSGDTSRCATYEEPRLAYLFLRVHSASGLRPRANNGKPNGMADPFVHIRVGEQEARSAAASDTLAPVWNDGFAFVVAKPFADAALLTLYDGEEGSGRVIGRVVLPLRDVALRPRGSRAVPAPRWYRVSRASDGICVAAQI